MSLARCIERGDASDPGAADDARLDVLGEDGSSRLREELDDAGVLGTS
jgi:hypothetical protein